jgi:hypothetical protein
MNISVLPITFFISETTQQISIRLDTELLSEFSFVSCQSSITLLYKYSSNES